jgi:membrane protease YdiL (CAAX protease family)
MKKYNGTSQFSGIWIKLPLTIRATISGFLVSSAGIAVWATMILLIQPPWTIVPMIFALCLYWKFFSGRWKSKGKNDVKRNNFRRIKLSRQEWKWGLTAAIFFVIIIQASFVITFRIMEFPKAQFNADYPMLNKMPLWIAWVMLTMSSVVAGICEETGYRGYLQVPVENKYGPVTAIIVTSVVFTLIHLGKTWAHPILPHIFFASSLLGLLAYKSGSLIPGIIGHTILDIFDYSFWWTGIGGGFNKQTIFKTGIDMNFIMWLLIFIAALLVFFKSVTRFKKCSLSLKTR